MNPRVILLAVLALPGCALFQHAGDSSDEDATSGYEYPADFDLYDGPTLGRVNGIVLDLDGDPVADAELTLSSGAQAWTDSEGAFVFDDVEPDELVVHVDADGYVQVDRAVTLEGWETRSVHFELMPIGQVFSFTVNDGGVFSEGPLTLSVPEAAFQFEDGSQPQGEIELTVTAPDLSATGTKGSPGDFMTVAGEGSVPMASFGFFEVRAEQNGRSLNVIPGLTVGVDYELPGRSDMPAAQLDLLEESIPLWWWNRDEAGWEYVDEAVIQQSGDGLDTVMAELPHFSTWNLDYLFDSTCVEVTVTDKLDNPIEGVEVSLMGLDFTSMITDTTDSEGKGVVVGMPFGTAVLEAKITVRGMEFNEAIDPYTLGGATSASSGVCAIEETIQLPVCIVGGDLLKGVAGGFSLGADNVMDEYRVPWGTAKFYEPSGVLEWCEDPIEEMEMETCETFEPEQDYYTGMFTDDEREWIKAGEVVRAKLDNTVALDLKPYEEEGGKLTYRLQESDQLLEMGDLYQDGTKLDLKVQGEEGGMPGFEVSEATTLPIGPLKTEPTNTTTVDGNGNVSLDMVDEGDENGLFMSFVANDDDVVLCRFEDGDNPKLPYEVLGKLPDDKLEATIFRADYGFVPLPTGTMLRTITTSSTTIEIVRD